MKRFGSIESRHGVDRPGYEPRLPPAPEPDTDEHDAVIVPPVRHHRGLGPFGALIVTGLIVVVVALYFNGNLDRPLYAIGLNFNECARNGLGATFCGKELDEARERAATVKQEGEESEEKLKNEEAEQAATAKRESDELDAKIKREGEAAERQANEEQITSEEQLRREEQQLSE